MKLRRLLERIGRGLVRLAQGERWRSPPLLDETARVGRFAADPEHTYLVSFPRTGSHWLRMLIEKYFERPQLRLTYDCAGREDYLTYHTHDKGLDIVHPNVLYLYREPVATVYSQMVYERSPLDSRDWVRYWSELYGLHLAKWLHEERFTRKKTVVRYERLQASPREEFSKVVAHFGESLDAERFERCRTSVTKEEVARRTASDARRINTRTDYAQRREDFRRRHAELVWSTLLAGRGFLEAFFDRDGKDA